MATSGEVQSQYPGSVGSEDLRQLKCQPCLEDGNLHETVGMCVDCQDYLCRKCFDVHKLHRPSRNHQLLDRGQMLQGQIRTSPKDKCTEKCPVHEDKVIKYYCTSHCLLGCTVCMTLDHKTCEGVQYIPHVAKELASNEEYRKVESQLKSALDTFKKVSENAKGLETSCTKALESIKEYRRKVDEALSKIEAELLQKAQALKSREARKLTAISDKYKKAQDELQSTLTKIKALQNTNQNCSSYTEMMRTKEKLNSLEVQIQEAETDKYMKCQIQFCPNLETLYSLTQPATLGALSGSGTASIERAKHVQDINVKCGTNKSTCWVTGLAVLPDNRLVLTDNNNRNIKVVSAENGQVLTQLKLSSSPWDITAISKNKIAVTLPDEKKVAIVTVDKSDLSIGTPLDVNGACYGVDYRNEKLAVSISGQHQVQVLNLQGSVLYNISADKQGNAIFNNPFYLTYGTNDTTLYVSNLSSNNVVCVKMGGTVLATYTDSNFRGPRKPVVDSRGHVLVCAGSSHTVHQITKDCKKIQALLTQAGGLKHPYSVCLGEEKDRLYVGMDNNNVKVYKTERRTQ